MWIENMETVKWDNMNRLDGNFKNCSTYFAKSNFPVLVVNDGNCDVWFDCVELIAIVCWLIEQFLFYFSIGVFFYLFFLLKYSDCVFFITFEFGDTIFVWFCVWDAVDVCTIVVDWLFSESFFGFGFFGFLVDFIVVVVIIEDDANDVGVVVFNFAIDDTSVGDKCEDCVWIIGCGKTWFFGGSGTITVVF